MVVVDAGNLAYGDGAMSVDRLPQQREKARILLDGWKLGGVDAMVPGEGDLALGIEWLKAEVRARELPMIAANLHCEGKEPFPGGVRVQAGEISIAVIGVLGQGTEVGSCMLSDPIEGLSSALAALGPADLVVVLAHEDPGSDRILADQVPEVDLLINGGAGASYHTPRSLPGDALALASGGRGKYLGVARLTLHPNASGFRDSGYRDTLASQVERFQSRLELARGKLAAEADPARKERWEKQVAFYEGELERVQGELREAAAPGGLSNGIDTELVALSRSVPDHAEGLKLVEEGKSRIELVAQAGARTERRLGPYVGSAACARCHKAETDQWAETPHARAWETLVASGRQLDLDCFACHATGAFDPEGPQIPTHVGEALQGVGCESCHGPGKAHSKSPDKEKLVTAPAEGICANCHDGERDEGRFELEAYLPKVRHTP